MKNNETGCVVKRSKLYYEIYHILNELQRSKDPKLDSLDAPSAVVLIEELVKKEVINDRIKFLHNIAMDIIGIDTTPGKNVDTIMRDFYGIMRKYGIKQGVHEEGKEVTVDSPEWSICYELMIYRIKTSLDFYWITSETPIDLI